MKIKLVLLIVIIFQASLSAFERGWVFQVQANVGGASTMPSINNSDLSKLGASYMKGMTGFVNSGEVQVGYIFDYNEMFKKNVEYRTVTNITYKKVYDKVSNSDKYTNDQIEVITEPIYEENIEVEKILVVKKKNKFISGIGIFGMLGVGQGYAGQISGAMIAPGDGNPPAQIDVFFNVYYTPVVSFGAIGKLYLLQNRLAIGLGLGGRLIADMTPNYEFYSTAPEVLPLEVGTIIVDSWMVKNMNPLMLNTKISLEYNQPVLNRMELILGGFLGYDIFKPKYITMPSALAKLSADVYGFDQHEELKSFYLNTLNFGIVVGLGFKI